MISAKELYRIWAPADSIWSPWVSPSVFAQIECPQSTPSEVNAPPLAWWEQPVRPQSAVIVDLPGGESIRFAVGLAKLGTHPVVINNASPGPRPAAGGLGTPSVTTFNFIAAATQICAYTHVLTGMTFTPMAPPAFILDSTRLSGDQFPRSEIFDNRWMVFPQDFPSAAFLIDKGIKRVVLVQEWPSQPQSDVAEILIRYQQAGISVLAYGTKANRPLPATITVRRPNRIILFLQRLLALSGLRGGSVGGFGSSAGEFIRVG